MAAPLWKYPVCRAHQNVASILQFSRIAAKSFVSPHQIRSTSSEPQHNKKSIVIPKRVKRDDLSILRALSKTVSKDPTALPFDFHDDPYLLPKSAAERRRYLLSKESGKKAAQYIIKTKPQLFLGLQKDQPKVEAFYPPVESLDIGEPSEEAILERLAQNDMLGALQVHHQLKDAGHTLSLETANTLLDYLCFHGGHLPDGETLLQKMIGGPRKTDEESEAGSEEPEATAEAAEPVAEETQNQKWRRRKNKASLWKDGNAADQLFESMEERDAKSYNSMIRGLAKHGAHARAFTLYNEMQERSIQADTAVYNALIEGSTQIREDYKERWSVMVQLMKQMVLENVRPDLETFNNLLDNLRIMGALGRKISLKTIAEMKACGVEPSLGTYSILLTIFYKDTLPPSDILYDILDTIEGQQFSIRHPKDVEFFKNAMSVCLSLRDVELAYRVDLLLNTGENYKLAGDYNGQNIYYGKFFHLLCLMDTADSMLQYYNKLVPSALIPSTVVYMDMLRSLETACSYDPIPQLWDDICMYGHRYRQNVLELLVQIMATPTDATQEQKSQFCSVVLDIVSATKESQSRMDPIKFGNQTLDFMVSICLQAKELEAAWHVLELLRKGNTVPSLAVLEDFLKMCAEEQDFTRAVGGLKMAVGSGLTGAGGMADRIKADFKLTAEQRKLLEDIMIEEDMISDQASAI